jgi:hypothetical protein
MVAAPFGSSAATGEYAVVPRSIGLYPQFSWKPVQILLPMLAIYALSGPPTANTSVPASIPLQNVDATTYRGPIAFGLGDSGSAEFREVADPVQDLAPAIREVRDSVGLTWEQLALLFGVSRRAVHHWANGSKMTGKHAQRLGELRRAFAALPGTDPESRRAALFTPANDGYSTFDRLRAANAAASEEIAPRYTPAELLGVSDHQLDD